MGFMPREDIFAEILDTFLVSYIRISLSSAAQGAPDTSSRLLLCGLWTEEINRALTNRELAVMASRSSSRSDKSKSQGVRE